VIPPPYPYSAIARAISLDPEIFFFDEPSVGLDPVTARLLDELILELLDSLEIITQPYGPVPQKFNPPTPQSHG
jgi:ABC-type antimicrobial peptide transport system ATPase subunit